MTKMNPHLIIPSLMAVAIVVLLAFIMFAPSMRAEPMVTMPELGVGPLNNHKLIQMERRIEAWDGESEGRHGERGPTQIKFMTWKQHTKKAWTHALYKTEEDKVIYRDVEADHAAWIRDEMERHKLPQTAYTFALIWRAGMKNVLNHNVTVAEKDYAERAENIYRSLIK
jgi:hypothetical protein